MNEVFCGANRQVVHHLQAAGNNARRDDIGHCTPGFFHRIERGEQHFGHLWSGQQLDRDFGDNPEHAFGAGEQGQQVEARRVQRIAAQRHGLALDGEDLDFEQVVHGQAVFEAVHAACVFRHVTADGAGDLRGRVGGVIKPVGRSRLGNSQVAHAGLYPREPRGRVYSEDLVEARHHQQHTFFQWQRAPRQAGARTACNHWHAMRVAQPQQRLHFFKVARQHHQHRRGAVSRQPVALVRPQLFGAVQYVQVGQLASQLIEQLLLVDSGQHAVNAFVVKNIHQATQHCFYRVNAS